ncbi:DMT family transporter [Candidatus Uabimicrobium sp. HlEnr_7]|uniref:DMT family transporter n=1 Tax=Candidatus Uabimicrobium helgolandensis TaxID=3095367 RepID=UPI003556B341
MTKIQNPARHITILLLGITGISFAPIFVRYSQVSPSAIAFWRVTISAIILGVIFFSYKRKTLATKKISWIYLLLPGVFFAGDLALWHSSIKMTSVANATLFANFACIFVTIVSWKWFGERITWRFVLGAVCAVIGVIVLLGVNIGNAKYLQGDILGLLTALFYASYILSIKKLREYYGALQIMFFSSSACSLCLLPTLLQDNSIPNTIQEWSVLFALAVVSHCIGQGLIAYALAKLAASFSSVSLLLQPTLAAIWAWLLLSEPLSSIQILGGGIVLLGIYFARKGQTS